MATQSDALAQVYARSLYELAEEAGGRDKIAEIGDELEQIGEMIRSDRGLLEFMASPIVAKRRREECLRRIFSDRVTDLTQRFLLVLNDKGRLGHLAAITNAYDLLVQQAYGRVEVDVFTHDPLAESQLEALRGRIREAIGREPVVYAYTDPSMIGGIKLRIGDQLIDGSVAGRLRRMRHGLAESGGRIAHDRATSFYKEDGA